MFPATIIASAKYHGQRFIDAFINFLDHGGPASAGNMAFLAMLSVFPFVIFLIALSGFFGQTDKGLEAIELMLDMIPTEVASVLEGPIQGVLNNTSGKILTFSILIALWTAASGIEAARHALIQAFGKDFTQAFWRRRLESLIIVIIAAILMLVSISIQVIGPTLMTFLSDQFPNVISESISELWVLLRYLISPLVLCVGLFGLYMALTPRRVEKPKKLPGALMSLAVFMLTATGLSTYLKYAGNYDVTYGSLAGVVILQIFCFIIAIGFILGAELNASYTRQAMKRAQDAASKTNKIRLDE